MVFLVNSVATIAFTELLVKIILDAGLAAFMQTNLSPAEPARAVVWLCHETCKANGEIIATQGQVVNRIFLADSRGFQGSRNADRNVEGARDNWAKAVDEKNFVVPTNTEEAGGLLSNVCPAAKL